MWISSYVNTGSGKEQRFRLVYSEQEALAWYKAANFLDCRIRAYHSTDSTDDTNIAPSILHVDVDREHFNTTEEFEQCAAKTRANFKEILDGQPTQIWTGNGLHFLQPQFAIILEKVEKFKQPSMKFMRFEEQLLTDGKADQNHSNNVSFGNCMLRIPGSLNSNQVRFNEKYEIVDIPPEAEVRVVQHWDGYKPPIKPLLPRYYIWLQAADARDIDKQMEAMKYEDKKYRRRQAKNTIDWIENLLEIPLEDFRKYIIKFILAPYLMNIRGLSRSDASDTLSMWLNRCDSICKLRFDINRKINEALDMVRDYLPKDEIR
jgi:hypothetical protein